MLPQTSGSRPAWKAYTSHGYDDHSLNRQAELPVPDNRLSRGEMRQVHHLPGEQIDALQPLPVTAAYSYPKSANHATDIGAKLCCLPWPCIAQWWQPGMQLPDFMFDFNELIVNSQVPDVVANELLGGWVSEMHELKEVLEDLMDALEWPEEADLALLGPPPDDHPHMNPDRLIFAEALRKRVARMHSLTVNLHVGGNLCGVAAMLAGALESLVVSPEAALIALDDENARREIDDVIAVVLERIVLVMDWHRNMQPHFSKIGEMAEGEEPSVYHRYGVS